MPARQPYLWKPEVKEAVQAALDAGAGPAKAARDNGLKPKQVYNAITQGALVDPKHKPRIKNVAAPDGFMVSLPSPAEI